MTKKRWIGLILALVILVGMYFIPVPDGLTVAGRNTLGITLAMLICFVTGALPLGLTALIFLVLFYLLGAAESLRVSLSGLAEGPAMFILASFGMSEAVSGCALSNRILSFMLRHFGKSIRSTLLALMFAVAFVSAFISNVPTTAMFITVGLAFLKLYDNDEDRKKTGRAYMIAIPVAAMIGGIMTPVGSSPNLVAISALEKAGYSISFVEWCCYGVPVALLLVPTAWFVITRVFPPVELNKEKFAAFVQSTRVSHKPDAKEWKVILILLVMIGLWVASSWVKSINMFVVAILGVAVMFLPGIDVLDWKSFMGKMNWDVFLVTGAVVSLGTVINANGISDWFVATVFPAGLTLQPFAMVFVVAIFVYLMLLVVPISGALIMVLAGPLITVATGAGMSPVILIVTLCFCATNCYLLPIDTVPLLGYSTGYFSMSDMPKATWMILLALAILLSAWAPLVFAIL